MRNPKAGGLACAAVEGCSSVLSVSLVILEDLVTFHS